MGLVETALEYAGRGWATIPFRPDKKPLYDDWPNKATTEPGQVTQYFTKYPNAIIAIVTGAKSGIWVLDIDVYAGKPGMESLLELERKYGELPETVRALSWSKGTHYYFKYTKPVRNRAGKGETAGIDVRGDGGCIFAPGSHYKGEKGEGDYVWELGYGPNEVELLEAPQWIYDVFEPEATKFTIPEIVEPGTQDDTMFRLACSLKSQGFKEGEVRASLETALTKCPPKGKPFGEMDINRWIESAFKYPITEAQLNPHRTEVEWGLADYRKIENTCGPLSERSGFFRALDGRIVRINSYSGRTEEVTPSMLLTELSKFVKFTAVNTKLEKIERKATTLFCQQVLDSEHLKLRILEAVTSIPRLDHDGTVNHNPGYNILDRSYYVKGFDIPTITFLEGKTLLEELFSDFPFTESKDKAAAYSLVLAPPLARIIKRFPLHAISANQARTGKSLLVECVMSIYGQAGALDWSRNEDELKKKITALLIGGPMFACFDNVKGRVQNSAVEACLTTGLYLDRLLGKSEMVRIPSQAIWIITGNNLEFGTEMIKRAVKGELNVHMENPELRTGFKHVDLKLWVEANRGKLLGSVYAILGRWVSLGMPKAEKMAPMGGFEAYRTAMGGVMEMLEIDGLGNEGRDSVSDVEHTQELNFLEAWFENSVELQSGRDYAQASDLVDLAMSQDIWVGSNSNMEFRSVMVGKKLTHISRKHYNMYHVSKSGPHRDGTHYVIKEREKDNESRPF